MDYAKINYGRPEWEPAWIVRFERNRLNDDWLADGQSRIKPPLWKFTTAPDQVAALWLGQSSTQPGKWKKLYIARRESIAFPAEWRLICRVPADTSALPADFDKKRDPLTPAAVDMSSALFLLPPSRNDSLSDINKE